MKPSKANFLSKKIIVPVLMAALTTASFAVDKPSGEEVKRVMDYYKNGQGLGAVLVDTKITSGVHSKGENKNEAIDEIVATEIQLNDKAFVWMNFLVPTQDKANLFFEFKRKGKARRAEEMSINGTTRYRTWKKLPTNKLGEWEVIITQELSDDNEIQLAKINYTVI